MDRRNKYLAKLAIKCAPCAFCNQNVDEETLYGKLYSIGDIHCHYFCVLLSCCLIQKGKDEEGLFGFLYVDIIAEIERSKKHKCSYCYREGATLGCSITQCKKQFHLPCGREKRAVSLFYGNYKSFCENHAPKQKIPDIIMSKAKLRLSRVRNIKRQKSTKNLLSFKSKPKAEGDVNEEPESVCVICYEEVDGYPTTQTFWPPCCARDAWFHRNCVQRMALSSGVHYFKCPLCNDRVNFSKAVLNQGYFIPDRDAAWELEQNAFSEIYERPVVCCEDECKCPRGREYDSDSGPWSVKLCVLCGGSGAHAACCPAEYYVCVVCAPAAPDHSQLAAIDAVSLPSQSQNSQRAQYGPIMPSRMSIRRTKQRNTVQMSLSSSAHPSTTHEIPGDSKPKTNTELSREDLNLKTPKRPIIIKSMNTNILENEILSPLKLLEQGLYERISSMEATNVILDDHIVKKMKEKFRKPKPLIMKKRIVDKFIEDIIQNIKMDPPKVKEPIKGWNSPKKILDNQNSVTEDNAVPVTNIKLPRMEINDQEHILKTCLNTGIQETKNNGEKANSSPIKLLFKIEDGSPKQSKPLYLKFKSELNSSLPIIDTPKKLKKINIEKDSMEISENDQVVNIDLVKVLESEVSNNFKIPEKTCTFKMSPSNKDILEKNIDIDVESFKNQYLHEVDRNFNCKYEPKCNENLQIPKSQRTSIDFAMDVLNKPLKRKLPPADEIACKRKKSTNLVQKMKTSIKVSDNNERGKRNKKKFRRKNNTELSIRNRNISLKIRFKDEEVNVKINKPKRKKSKNKNKPKILKQYVLNYLHTPSASIDLISRPESDVTPMKRKYVKNEKSFDSLKQTSIDFFFKKSPTNAN